MIAPPAQFRVDGTGQWILTAPIVDERKQFSIRGSEAAWVRRCQHSVPFETSIFFYEFENEFPGWHIQTRIMCDPLQALSTFMPAGDRLAVYYSNSWWGRERFLIDLDQLDNPAGTAAMRHPE